MRITDLHRSPRSAQRCRRRRGAVLIAVVVCLTIAMTLVVSWLKIAAIEHRAERDRQNRLQADWLAESALDRAAASLTANANYSGEIWKLTPEEIGGSAAGEVEIRVESVDDEPRRRRIHVQADYPSEGDGRHRRGKELVINLTP